MKHPAPPGTLVVFVETNSPDNKGTICMILDVVLDDPARDLDYYNMAGPDGTKWWWYYERHKNMFEAIQ